MKQASLAVLGPEVSKRLGGPSRRPVGSAKRAGMKAAVAANSFSAVGQDHSVRNGSTKVGPGLKSWAPQTLVNHISHEGPKKTPRRNSGHDCPEMGVG